MLGSVPVDAFVPSAKFGLSIISNAVLPQHSLLAQEQQLELRALLTPQTFCVSPQRAAVQTPATAVIPPGKQCNLRQFSVLTKSAGKLRHCLEMKFQI